MDHVYRVTEVVGSSPESVDQAVRNAILRAGETLRNLDWFEVTEIRGHVVDGEVGHFQVAVKIGFRLEDVAGS
jgi:flavin-binding protein dodecin